MAVHFSPRLVEPAAELARLWQKWRDRYPLAEDRPPLPPPGLQPAAPSAGASGYLTPKEFEGLPSSDNPATTLIGVGH